MDYIELKVTVVDEQQAEILTTELAEYPFESFITVGTTLKAYLPEASLAGCRAAVDAMLNGFGVMRRSYAPVPTQNWNATWEGDFEPVTIEGCLVIRAPFHPAAAAGTEEVIIMPHMSFGTGHHATTYLMSATLLDLDVAGKRGLDMGSGTGVLAIVAARHGAASVDAVDIDDWADENCRTNAKTNGVSERITPLLGDVRKIAGNQYDFILANINRNILTTDMPSYAAMLTTGGDLLLSGFLEQDTPLVTASAEAQGLRVSDLRTRDGWAMIHCVKE